MKYNLAPFIAHGQVESIASKSYAHRIIILSALAKGKTKIYNVGNSNDVLATIDCVKKLGAKVEFFNGYIIVEGIETLPKTCLLDFNESGSTMRFMIPVCAGLGVNARFSGRGKLLTRPNDKLYSVLALHGANVENNNITGKLDCGEYRIDASVSSQYISGLLMALTRVKGNSKIILEGSTVSANYITMTLEVLKQFGVEYLVERNEIILINNNLSTPKEITVEGDWSSAASMLCFGALGKGVEVKGLNLKSTQSDAKIIDFLAQAGAVITFRENSIKVERGKLNAIECDIKDCPDLAPVLSSVLAYCKGVSKIKGVDRLMIKESNRLQAIIDNLKSAHIKTKYAKDTLYIYGKKVKGANFCGFNDHRMVMSSCVLASNAKGKSSVSDVEAVSKSYPNFFEHLTAINGVFYE